MINKKSLDFYEIGKAKLKIIDKKPLNFYEISRRKLKNFDLGLKKYKKVLTNYNHILIVKNFLL